MSKDMVVQGPQISQFNNIAPNPIPRSAFKRDFTRRTTFNADLLVPIMVDEILPGDDFRIKLNAFTRVATPIKPIMDNLYQETFAFFVPYRLVWNNWEKFQGMQINPGDSVAYTIPILNNALAPMSTTGFLNETLYDYLGLPTLVTSLDDISALYCRAYYLIWNDWFRDENLQNSLTVPTGDGPDDPAQYTLKKRRKKKDYITSMLPWPQKGAAVTLPLGTTAPILNRNIVLNTLPLNTPVLKSNISGAALPNANLVSNATGLLNSSVGPAQALLDPNGTLQLDPTAYADLSAASAATLNSVRQAALYQQILELDARGGTRYVESIYSRFGVVSPDFRLQRPELLGQGSNRINVYAVPQTAPTSAGDTPQGNLAAFGTSQIMGTHGCHYSATEHGMLIYLMNVRADLTYQQGVPRMFTRRTRLDMYEPLLNGLGEQAVYNREFYADGTATDVAVGGYQERFAEYRFKMSEVTGKFRSNDPQTLDVWHLSQEFGSLPSLNSSFIESNTPMDRVIAVTDEPDFLCDIAFDYHHVRPMPVRSNPGIDIL